jgi:hypothetical protein
MLPLSRGSSQISTESTLHKTFGSLIADSPKSSSGFAPRFFFLMRCFMTSSRLTLLNSLALIATLIRSSMSGVSAALRRATAILKSSLYLTSPSIDHPANFRFDPPFVKRPFSALAFARRVFSSITSGALVVVASAVRPSRLAHLAHMLIEARMANASSDGE